MIRRFGSHRSGNTPQPRFRGTRNASTPHPNRPKQRSHSRFAIPVNSSCLADNYPAPAQNQGMQNRPQTRSASLGFKASAGPRACTPTAEPLPPHPFPARISCVEFRQVVKQAVFPAK